jgi:hypothetical protein
LLYVIKYDLFWSRFCWILKKMSVFKIFWGIFCSYLLSPVGLFHYLILKLCVVFVTWEKWSTEVTYYCLRVCAFMSNHVLWNWVHRHLVPLCLQLLYLPDGLFQLLIHYNLLCLLNYAQNCTPLISSISLNANSCNL